MSIAVLTHEYNGGIGWWVRNEAEKLAQHGVKIAIIYPSEYENITINGNIAIYSVSTIVKTYLNIVVRALILISDFTRAFSRLVYDYGFNFNLIYTHEWIAGISGVVLKSIFNKPLIASIYSTEYMRSSEVGLLQLSIRGYEKQVFEEANLILAKSRNTLLSISSDYGIGKEKIVEALNIDEAVETVIKVFNI
ncbi:MAG: glycosyltransferase [Candidatus Methanomethylicia archaeon]